MNCNDAVYGNEYYDFIVTNNQYLPPVSEGICTLDGGKDFAILFVPSGDYPAMSVRNYAYNAIPKCYTPLSLEALDASGILDVRDTPTLALDGKGVLLGFLDTGIDTTHPAFLDENGNSRIVAVWDQNYREVDAEMAEDPESENAEVPGVYYGKVYSGNTLQQYGNGDTNGHGTYVASVAAGSARGDYSGAAPGADIAMVHLKDAKAYLKDYYFIPQDRLCFQENDIMLGVQFLNALALQRNQPLVICMSLGSNMGSHSGNSPLGRYLNEIAALYRRCVVCGTGNEADKRHHAYGKFLKQEQLGISSPESELISDSTGSAYIDVEIVVGDYGCSFMLEQWSVAPNTFQIALIAPSGEILPRISIQLLTSQEFYFPIEGTRVMVDYSMPEATTGNQLIYYRFKDPTPGIWRIRVFWQESGNGIFHMYLPQQELQCEDVIFLSSNPDATVMEPGNAYRVLTFGGYRQRQNSLFLESGRGYALDGQLKPELVAPAVDVDGAVAGTNDRPEGLQYEARSGTSAAAAIGAGGAAMYMQWCERQMDYRVNTLQVKNFFIRGARTFPGDLYPNPRLGHGALDVYRSFEMLRNL